MLTAPRLVETPRFETLRLQNKLVKSSLQIRISNQH